MTSVGLVVQARMGSTRLPGKVLKDIGDRPLLAHVVGRVNTLASNFPLVVATTTASIDDDVVAWCEANGVKSFRGSEMDVLDRYAQCVRLHDFDHVVRLTADNPFTDMEELARLVALHLERKNDYTHSFGLLPIGIGAEIFTREALERSDREGLAPNHREHVNEYIQERPEVFRIGALDVPQAKQAPSLRLTVDTESDWARADALARQSAGRWLGTQEAISLCLASA